MMYINSLELIYYIKSQYFAYIHVYVHAFVYVLYSFVLCQFTKIDLKASMHLEVQYVPNNDCKSEMIHDIHIHSSIF